jgi:uncharacterized protein
MYEETVDLAHLPAEGVQIERRIHPNAWKIQEEDWESRGEVLFRVFIHGNMRKVSVNGHLDAGIIAYCHRCLKRTDVDLRRDFHLTYLAPDPERFSKEEVALTNEELEVAYLDKSYLSLQEMIQEQIYLAIPMKFLCEADCRGLCPHCGVNLNEVECGCATEQIDPRWASLKAIVNEKK